MGFSKFSLHDQSINDLAKVAKVFGHPARVAIVNYISTHKDCICNDIVKNVGLAQPTISQHLTEIKRIGLLNQTEKGKRLCYSINETVLNESRRNINSFFVKTQVNIGKQNQ